MARDLSRSAFLGATPQSLSVAASSLNRANSSITVEGWVNVDDFTDDGSGQMYIAAYNVGTGSFEGWWLRLQPRSTLLEFGSWNGVDHKASWNYGLAAWNTGDWHHLAGSWDSGSTTWKVYFDGTLQASNNDAQGPCASANGPFAIGRFDSGSGGRYFFGRVAEFTVRNLALTDGEVQALASRILTVRVRPATIIGGWHLDGLASPEPDFSGNANNLTLTNAPAQGNHAPITLRTPRQSTPMVPALPFFGAEQPAPRRSVPRANSFDQPMASALLKVALTRPPIGDYEMPPPFPRGYGRAPPWLDSPMADPIRAVALTRPPISNHDQPLPRMRLAWAPPDPSRGSFAGLFPQVPFFTGELPLSLRRAWRPAESSSVSVAIQNSMTLFPRTTEQPGPRSRAWKPPESSGVSVPIQNAMTLFPRTTEQPGPSWGARDAAWRIAMASGTVGSVIALTSTGRLYGVTAGPGMSVFHGMSHDKAHGLGRAGAENIPQDDPTQFPTDF